MAPIDALADPMLEPPPLNERGRVSLLSPIRELTLILGPDEVQYGPNGSARVVEKGPKLKFRAHRYEVTLEEWWLVAQHPAYTGAGEPRIVFLEDEGRFIDTQSGAVRVVDGAMTAGSQKRTPPPIQGWDALTYAQLRKLLADGVIPSPLDALIYERQHRSREGVIRLLLAAASGADLPTTRQMQGADRSAAAKQAAAQGGDPHAAADAAVADPDPDPPAAGPVMAESDADIAAELRAALESETGTLDDAIAEDADEPIPGEGVQ